MHILVCAASLSSQRALVALRAADLTIAYAAGSKAVILILKISSSLISWEAVEIFCRTRAALFLCRANRAVEIFCRDTTAAPFCYGANNACTSLSKIAERRLLSTKHSGSIDAPRQQANNNIVVDVSGFAVGSVYAGDLIISFLNTQGFIIAIIRNFLAIITLYRYA